MLGIEARRIPAHHHPDLCAARINPPIIERPHHGSGMLLERPPGKTGLEEEGREDEVEVPGDGEVDEREGCGEERDGQNGPRDPGNPLDADRVAGRDAPPPDEPAEERHRMVT